ncbi:MAG: tetratricopeptide repeat protein [Bacteroidales bacterium]
MTTQDVIKDYQKICKMLHRRQVADVIPMLRKMVGFSNREFMNEQLDELLDTYRNILRHSFTATKDPERKKVYHYLIRSLLELADELKEFMLTREASLNTYRIKQDLLRNNRMERGDAMRILESLTLDKELASLLKEVNVGDLPSREEGLVRVFNIIWLSDKYSEGEMELLQAACDSPVLPWHDKSLVVSALTLSLLRYFDLNKFLILFRFLEKRQEFVWERAMVGVFLGFLKYNDRYYLYPQLEEKTLALQEFPNIEQNIEAILIQFTKSKETDKVKKKWEKEILPEIMKMRPKIEEKLDLDNIFQEEFGEEKNPDWETVFEDAPDLLNKLQEFTEMQMEGMDVFISAFSQLKGFPFFREISNWFVPFHAGNQILAPITQTPGKEFDLSPLVEKLETTYFMCNSDKYSFCLNLEQVPDQQKAMMMNMLNAEMENIGELEKDEGLINSFARTKSVYTQYFQDLYRFFKLHPWRREFDDMFNMELDLYETSFVKHLVSDRKTIRNIAEFYFDKKFYPDALKVFLAILDEDRSNIELFEKIAFCYEKTGRFDLAFNYYQKADLIDSNRLWIIKKLAYCCKLLNRWTEALRYYREAEKQDPEDLKIQANTGQCLIHLGQYQEALDVYFKVEVLAPENHRIRRPLAWCSFILGKLDTARDYLERLLAEEPGNKYDLMNMGHVLWCMKEPDKALKAYSKSLAAWGSIGGFTTSFNEDRKHLALHSISDFDMDLMLDFLHLKAREE